MNQWVLIIIIGVLNMASPFALHIFPPAAPFVRRDLDLSVVEAQWSVTAFIVVLAISMIVFGPLADRFDRKRLVLGGSAVFTVGCIIAAVAPNLFVLIIGRSLQAVGAASASVVARAIAASVFVVNCDERHILAMPPSDGLRPIADQAWRATLQSSRPYCLPL